MGNELQGYVRKPESLDSFTIVSNTKKSTKSVDSAKDIYDILQDCYNHRKETPIATFFENGDGNELRRSEERSIAGVHTASRTITEGTREIGLSPDNREHIVEEGKRNTDTRDSAYLPKPTDCNIRGGQFTVESGKIVRDLGLGNGEDCSFPIKRERQTDGTSGGGRFGNSGVRSGDRNYQDNNMASVFKQQQAQERSVGKELMQLA